MIIKRAFWLQQSEGSNYVCDSCFSMDTIRYRNYGVDNEITSVAKRLYRPKIFFKTLGIVISFSFLLIGQGIIMDYSTSTSTFELFKDGMICLVFTLFVLLDFIGLFLICVYQKFASASTRSRCVYRPSCSNFAKLAIWKYGIFIALPLILLRFHKCGKKGGIDFP